MIELKRYAWELSRGERVRGYGIVADTAINDICTIVVFNHPSSCSIQFISNESLLIVLV